MNTANTRYWITYTRSSKLKPSSLFGFELLIESLLYCHSARSCVFGKDSIKDHEHYDGSRGVAHHLPSDRSSELTPRRYKRQSLFEHLVQCNKQHRVCG